MEDVTQEIWLAIYKGLPGLLDAGKFRPWAFRIARDRIYREYRRRKMAMEPLEESHLEELPEAVDANAIVDVEELHRGLDAISPEHREVLVLCFFEEMNTNSISQTNVDSSILTLSDGTTVNRQVLVTLMLGKAMNVTSLSVTLLGLGTLLTLMLVIFNRHVTLRQLNASLTQISSQIKALQDGKSG